MNFMNCSNDQMFCLVGNEGYRLEKIFDKELPDKQMHSTSLSKENGDIYTKNTNNQMNCNY